VPTDAPRPLVLVVDDEEGIRGLLSDILEDLGFDVLAFADGEAAVAAVAAKRPPVKLAIVDFVLPGAGGIDTMRALRAIAPGLPGIISSGYGDDESGAALRAAAQRENLHLLGKPYKIDALTGAIDAALKR
jgi:DNA-binding NtrC family response regulator